jgi:DNA replication protein DnaC
MWELASDEQKQEYYFDDFTDKLPCFIEVPELLLRIRDTYRSRTGTYIDKGIETEKDIVECFTKTPFLVLDDLGVEKSSEFSTLMIYLIINRRCTSGKTTIITSNLSLSEIQERLSERISSRIKGMCREITVTGNDKRYKTERQRGNDQSEQH